MTSMVLISTDKKKLELNVIHEFLSQEARWSLGIPLETVAKSITHSLCFGAYLDSNQIGFARMVTDYATFGNLVDVFVLQAHRGKGICRQLLQAVNEHPELQGLRRITLATSDKKSLYTKFGYTALIRPEIFMEKFTPDVYN